MNDQSCKLSHFRGQFHDADCMTTPAGRDPTGFHSTIISLILAEPGSTRNRAVDQCAEAEALDQDQSQPHRTSEKLRWRPSGGGESALRAVKRWRFEAGDRESTTTVELKVEDQPMHSFYPLSSPAPRGLDVPCSMMPWHEIL